MENKLRFNLRSSPNPYLCSDQSTSEKWGCLSIVLLKSNEEFNLLQIQWDLCVLIRWLFENQSFLTSELLLIPENGSPLPDESLTQAIQRLLDREFSEDQESEEEQWYEAIFNFRQHHALRSALHGANIPDIFIGLNHGYGEISLCNSDENWCYQFDMNDFFNDFIEQVKLFPPGFQEDFRNDCLEALSPPN